MSCKGLVGHWSGRNMAVSGGHPLLVSLKKGKNATYLELMFPRRKMGFPSGSDGKESACNAGDLDLILGSGRCPGEENGNTLQYSCLGNSMDRGAWWAKVHGIVKESETT